MKKDLNLRGDFNFALKGCGFSRTAWKQNQKAALSR